MADMTLAEKIHDAFLDRDLTAGDINCMIADRLYAMLCAADGALSAIRHGRKLGDKELEGIYYPIRDFCNELAVPGEAVDSKSAMRAKQLKESIEECIEHANGRESEWGERAEACFEILRKAVAK